MADRRAEERRAVLLGYGEQRDLAVEADELLDNQLADVSARPFAAIAPSVLQLFGSFDERLAFARRRHQGFHHARITDLRGGLLQLVVRRRVEIAGGLQPQLLGRKVADGFAVHREVDGAGARHDLHARLFELVEPFGADRLDFGHDDVGTVFPDGGGQRVAVEHVKHFACVGDLHGGGARIRVAGDDGLSQPLRRDHEFLAQLTRTEQHYFFHGLLFF